MCGIAGLVSIKDDLTENDRNLGKAMTLALRHRGPDSRGEYAEGKVYLGNARLKITDMSDKADLPFVSDDGNVILAFNGAVTNFRQLRMKHKLDSFRKFRSKSDAEVVLSLYQKYGLDCLRELSGHFAMSIYDRLKNRVYVIRDLYGLRPLFYLIYGEKIYFASEIKALLEVSGWDRSLDREALWHFFTLAYIPGEHTPFANIHELRGGELIEIDPGARKYKVRTWAKLNYEPDRGITEEEAVRRTRELLLRSVKNNFDTDARTGMTLSGGLDTSGILGLAKELGLSENVHTFSVSMMDNSFDEAPYQRIMSSYARSIHHEIKVSAGDVVDSLFSTVAHLDEPTGDGAAVPSFILAREAKKYVKVLLSGEGGDEVFNAYETHRAYKARRLYRKYFPKAARSLISALAHALPVSHRKLSLDFVAKRFAEGCELEHDAAAHIYWRYTLTEEQKKSLLRFPAPAVDTDRLFIDAYDKMPYPDGLNRISQLDMRYYFIDDLMVKNDRSIMAHSIETRFPYMDDAVVKFAATIPPEVRLKGLFGGRYIEKQALKPFLPAKIFNRTNMGLEMPHSSWFFGGFKDLFMKYFTKEQVERSGILNYDAVKTLVWEHKAQRKDNGRALWCVLNFILWFDLFVYDGNYKDYLVRE